ncbi:MAG: hypothetical protein P8P98_01740, partial [Emcibacteraceae bacterium]|nr:hypothetical protein [Emcibacteraceae bacterium]
MENTLLVPSRECGECTACCVELTIEDPDLVKLPGVKCQHLNRKGGCGIYDTRPKTCKNWYCMWRFLPNLDDTWRPDLKGVMIKRVFNNIPAGYDNKAAINFEIIGKKSVIHDLTFIEVLGGYIVNGFPCFLSIGKPRRLAAMVLLNEQLKPLIESRNLPLLKETLSSALKA